MQSAKPSSSQPPLELKTTDSAKTRPASKPNGLPPLGSWRGIRARLASAWAAFPNPWTLWTLLLLITAAGVFLRFWRLGFQTYWADESHTIYRIYGDYARMLKRLDDQGFPPGWYTLIRGWANFQEWRLGSGALAFAPESLRLLPAFFGALTVPAMYFLARQFTDRRGALLVMLLAAVNPFLIYYSRDIKMYAGLWFFVTLNMGLFFKWQSTHRHWLWFPLYTLAGCCMTAMHGMAWIIVALQFIFILTRPRPKSLDALLWVIGLFCLSLLPLWWYDNGTKWFDNAVEGNSIGLGWITDYTDMSWKTIASLPSSHVFGFLWPESPPSPRIINWFNIDEHFNDHLDTRSWSWATTGEFWAIIGLFAVLVLGLFPWRGRRLNPERAKAVTCGRWWWVALWIVLPMIGLGLTWLPATGFSEVVSAASVADAKVPLDSPNLGLAHTPVSGTLTITLMGRGFVSTKMDIPIGGKDGLTLTTLAAAINDATDEKLSATVTPKGQLRIAARSGSFVLRDDSTGLLQSLGIQGTPNTWYWALWSWKSKPLPAIWEPRYLGVIVPAFLLWLAAALRRLPTAPLRILATLAVLAVCTISALTNHLLYRNTPYDAIAQTVMNYRMKSKTGAVLDEKPVAWNSPLGQSLRSQDLFMMEIRAGIRPWAHERSDDPPAGPFFMPMDLLWSPPPAFGSGAYSTSYRRIWDDGFTEVSGYTDFLTDMRNRDLAAIVLTDRLGDLPDVLQMPDGTTRPNPLSNEAVAKLLGPKWKLDSEQLYRWHYEWRFNIFSTWRTRVYVRDPSVPFVAPVITPPSPTTRRSPVTPPTANRFGRRGGFPPTTAPATRPATPQTNPATTSAAKSATSPATKPVTTPAASSPATLASRPAVPTQPATQPATATTRAASAPTKEP